MYFAADELCFRYLHSGAKMIEFMRIFVNYLK